MSRYQTIALLIEASRIFKIERLCEKYYLRRGNKWNRENNRKLKVTFYSNQVFYSTLHKTATITYSDDNFLKTEMLRNRIIIIPPSSTRRFEDKCNQIA